MNVFRSHSYGITNKKGNFDVPFSKISANIDTFGQIL